MRLTDRTIDTTPILIVNVSVTMILITAAKRQKVNDRKSDGQDAVDVDCVADNAVCPRLVKQCVACALMRMSH